MQNIIFAQHCVMKDEELRMHVHVCSQSSFLHTKAYGLDGKLWFWWYLMAVGDINKWAAVHKISVGTVHMCISLGISESILSSVPLSYLQTKINKYIRNSIYDILIKRIKPNLWLCASLLKCGLQKKIRIDSFKCLCQETCGSCMQGFWIFFFL